MKDIIHMASLLTYLESAGNKLQFNIPLSTQDTSLSGNNLFPFIAINDSDPFTRMIEARIASDAGCEVKKIFLFVQRDAYTLKKNALWPISNNDVRDLWQKTFSFYADRKEGNRSFIFFSDQLGKKGELLPFAPLFYCKKMKTYFHPPCPKCGHVLRQCEDDNLLAASGLYPFSTSLKRYLFCPECGAPDFFSHEMEQSASSFLKDGQTLLKNFAQLKKVEEDTAFPCLGCQLHEECYDRDHRVLTRIVPFSFYPFYMFAFEAASLNALDFITLISGAGFREAESLPDMDREFGRVASLRAVEQACAGNAPFLFDHDERHFLEILYLKLAFLEAVVRGSRSGGKFIHPDLKPGIDQIWVTFPEINGMLPYFWNFKIEIMGIGGHAPVASLSEPASDTLFLMGLVWFYTLLTNKRQKVSDVYAHIEKFSSEGVSTEKFMNARVFDPLNIFWEPQGKTIPASWSGLWERSLSLGWSLLNPDITTADGAGEEFLNAMRDLRKDIRENLLTKEIPHATIAPQAAERVSTIAEDRAIHEILSELIKKLEPAAALIKEEAQRKIPPAPSVEEYDEEPVTETVVLSARPSKPEARIPFVEETLNTPQPAAARKTEDEQETLILSIADLKERAKPQTKEPEEMIAETVVISPAEPAAKEVEKSKTEAQPEKTPPEEFLAETVVISPAGTPTRKAEKTERETPREKTSDDTFLAETVILKPGEKSKNGTRK